ncbi:MAG TPA: hypothetical protein VKT82_24615 [Ktedonobacterales bacterium]|nr:hypothetical protein [Ktedonobacterales bacterium]
MHFFRNEVSSEAIRGYLRLGTQIEQVWQQLDDKVTELTLKGLAPWEAYSSMGYALAFVRACRLNVLFVQKLLEGADPANSGFIPRPTYDQAQALGELFEPYLEEAIRLLDARYATRQRVPLQLRRVRHEGQYATAHFLGLMAAVRETREWAAGLLAQYELAIAAPKLPIPQPISTHLEAMKSQLALGDFHLESGSQVLGDLRTGKQVPDTLCAQGEDLLWEAMESFYRISQLLAYPGAAPQLAPARPAPTPQPQPSSGFTPAAPPGSKRVQTSAHVADMLGQLNQAHPASNPTSSPSGASDLLRELQMNASTGVPDQPVPDASTLLDQLQPASPPGKPSSEASPTDQQKSSQEPASTDKKVADLLSDLGGERPNRK